MYNRSGIWESWPRNTVFWSVFATNSWFLVKPSANLWISTKNLCFFKTCKNSYTWPLYITDPQYGVQDQHILSFGQFLAWTGDFQCNRTLTPMVLRKNLSFFKTHKNSYTGPLCITDPEYESHDHEMWVMTMKYSVSVSFCNQTGDFH
jgi:hypothetical protein